MIEFENCNSTKTARQEAQRADPGYRSYTPNSIYDDGGRLTAGVGCPGNQRTAAVSDRTGKRLPFDPLVGDHKGNQKPVINPQSVVFSVPGNGTLATADTLNACLNVIPSVTPGHFRNPSSPLRDHTVTAVTA